MRSRILGFGAWVLLLGADTARGAASVEIVLKDGQVYRGQDVRRAGDVYVFVLEGGGKLTLPVEAVARVKLEQGPPPGPVLGLTYAEPQQLVGPPVSPLTPAESQAVLGDPARFRPNVVESGWEPRSGFPEGDVLAESRSTWQPGVIDPTWTPQSAFPDRDVLASGRASFRPGVLDSTWTPQDGFRKRKGTVHALRSGPPVELTGDELLAPRPTPSETLTAESWYRDPGAERQGVHFDFQRYRPQANSAAVRACAERILGGPATTVHAVSEPSYERLGLEVFESSSPLRGGPGRTLFTVSDGQCRALGGDLRDRFGVPFSRESAAAVALEAYNASAARRAPPRLPTDEEKLEYAFAVLSLVDPDVGGPSKGSLVLLATRRDVEVLAARSAPDCSVAPSEREKAAKAVERRLSAPRVSRTKQGEAVGFFTWSSAGGNVARHTVRIAADGQVSIETETLASHVGPHRDRG